jgi:hypothetical protein
MGIRPLISGVIWATAGVRMFSSLSAFSVMNLRSWGLSPEKMAEPICGAVVP